MFYSFDHTFSIGSGVKNLAMKLWMDEEIGQSTGHDLDIIDFIMNPTNALNNIALTLIMINLKKNKG